MTDKKDNEQPKNDKPDPAATLPGDNLIRSGQGTQCAPSVQCGQPAKGGK